MIDREKSRRAHIALIVACGFFLFFALLLEGGIIVEAFKEVWAAESRSY